MNRRKQTELVSRVIILAGGLLVCICVLLTCCAPKNIEIPEEPLRTEETTAMSEETSTTTSTTTTETTTSTTKETTTTEVTTTSTSFTTTTTTETKSLLTYDILQRIEMINILLDESKYSRLLKKAPENLTSDERLELYYYNSLATERKHLREYLDKNK